MKKFIIAVIFCIFCITGCKNKERSQILFSSQPISASAPAETAFSTGEQINFILINPKEFTSNILRLQVLKLSDKVDRYGFSLAHGRDVEIDINKHYMIESLYFHEKGRYLLRIFSSDNYKTPLAEGDFLVE
ncbi:MAG: hypothetical protein PHV68_03385 [Candidatus Gastranaerophilales bacterium]|nr:hypothetical protein [Candidatus Gastranaerophilales bacterium]